MGNFERKVEVKDIPIDLVVENKNFASKREQ